MPSKSRRTKKENKRIDHKRARAAEAQALKGGRPGVVRGLRWASRVPQPPIMEESVGPQKRRSKVKKIKYCPGRPGKKRHAYLEGEEERYGYYYSPSDSRWKWFSRSIRYKLCAYCGKEKMVFRPRKGMW